MNDWVSFVAGRDPLLGEDLGLADRVVTGAAAVMPFVAAPVLRQGVKGMRPILDTTSDISVAAFGKLKGLAELGVQRHHLIEKRFSEELGMAAKDMLAIAIEPGAHQWVTNTWRTAIGYIRDRKPLTTRNAKFEDILSKAREIYSDFPEILQEIENQLSK